MLQVAQKEKLLNQDEIKVRESFGRRNAKKVIKEGFVPATLTSKTLGSIHFSIKTKTVEKMIKSPLFFASCFEVDVSGFNSKATAGNIKMIPKFIDFHSVNGYPLHIDFIHAESEFETLLIPVSITGTDKAPGLKKGGKLNVAKYHVPLLCDVNNIPEKLEVNISSFGIGRSVFLSKLTLPNGCKMIKDYLILSIIGRGKKDKEEEESAVAANAATPASATSQVKSEAKK